MLKKLLVFVVVLTLLALYTGTAFAAPSAVGSVVELLTAHGGASGTVFIFRVSGEFSGAELNGSVVMANGMEFPLYCAQIDAETVRCLTSSKVWGDVTVTFGGKSFATRVGPFERVFSSTSSPSEPTDPTDPIDPTGPTEPTEYCYGIYHWSNPSLDAWSSLGTNCQSSIANYGDSINFYDPYWDFTLTFDFMPNNPDYPVCAINRSGDAYYYPICPFVPN